MAKGFPVEIKSQTTPALVPRVDARDLSPSYSASVVNFTPVANATDIIRLSNNYYGRQPYLDKVRITGTATSASVLNVLLQRSSIDGSGTFAEVAGTASYETKSTTKTAGVYAYSANRDAGQGNGINGTRQLIASGKLYLGTASTPAPALEFTFTGQNRPAPRDLVEWIVVNLAGQAIPAGCSLNIDVHWSEQSIVPVQMVGDSTTSNAVFLFKELGNTGGLTGACNLNNSGSNGYRLLDALLGLGGIPYPIVDWNGVAGRLGDQTPGVATICYGINDMRQGATTRGELISRIDASIHAILNGTTSGTTYTSPMGANSAFTWTANTTAKPDTRIILWGPNSLTTDGNGSNFVELTGRFASNTLAEAAQIITDDLYFAYDAFKNDSRIFELVQKQDIFGRVSTTIANSGIYANQQGYTKTTAPLMTDILHPNQRGQVLSARQIAPVLRRAIDAASTDAI